MSRREVLLAIAIAIGVVALRAPLLDLPLERDEGGYAYVAWRLSAGEMPYLDQFVYDLFGIEWIAASPAHDLFGEFRDAWVASKQGIN